MKSGGHSTAMQRAPDRGGRCPAGLRSRRKSFRASRKYDFARWSCRAQRLARQWPDAPPVRRRFTPFSPTYRVNSQFVPGKGRLRWLMSLPPAGEGTECAQRHRSRRGSTQNRRSKADCDRTCGTKCRHFGFGKTAFRSDNQQQITGLRQWNVNQPSLRRLVQHQGTRRGMNEFHECGRLNRFGNGWKPPAPRLFRRFPSGVPPARQRLVPARARFPFRHTAFRAPRQYFVDSGFCRQFDREFASVALQQCLGQHDARPRLRFGPPSHHGQAHRIPVDATDIAVREAPASVGQHEFLAHPQSAHGRRVPALRTVQHRDVAVGQVLDKEDGRRRHRVRPRNRENSPPG